MIGTDTIERDILVHGRDKVIALLLAEVKRLQKLIALLLAEVKRLQKYSNVLENLMGLLDSSDEGDWILLETIDELMKEEGIARWSQEKDKTETNLI